MQIKPITELPKSFTVLEQESKNQGFNFLEKMNSEWQTGKNRFDQPGEVLLAAYQNEELIGIGGINIDPYLKDNKIGRIRHLYVLTEFRRTGIGRAMMEQLTEHARIHFDILRLRTDTKEAAAFYESLGFVPTQINSATHILRL